MTTAVTLEPAAIWFRLSDLVLWKDNPRHIPDAAVRKVAASIQSFGWGPPVLARKSDRRLIAGHTRYQAAKLLGLDLAPVRFIECSDAQADILALADNRLGQETEWDYRALAEVLRSFKDDAARLATGFDAHEIEPLLAATWEPAGTPPVPDEPVKPIDLNPAERAAFEISYAAGRKLWGDELEEGAFVADLSDRFVKAVEEA
jgi:ParB-like chromosome segregation protein Spo0J